MNNIKTIFFDVGGVLLTNGWDHVAREQAAEHFGYDHKASEARHQRVAQAFDEGRLNLDDYLKEVIFFRERPFASAPFIRFMESRSRAHPEALRVVEQLTNAGQYRLATINNESLHLNRYRIRAFELERYFDTFLSSCFLGIAKPDKAIFREALQITQCSGQECLFVDDREENVATARRCGFWAIHLVQPSHLEEALSSYDIQIPVSSK